MLDFNEGKACDAIVRCLEEREGQPRSDMRWPDQEGHKSPVEIAFKLGSQLFALEHTGVEPFPGHMEMENRSKHLYAPITNAVKDALGTESLFELHLPINAFQNRKRRDITCIQNALVRWVKNTAPTVPKPSEYRGTSVGPTSVSEVPFEVSLTRVEPPIVPDCHFQIRHVVKDLKKLRNVRMQQAVDDKLPKLARWKLNDNARTMLVLEQNDIQLTNPGIVADAFVPLVMGRADKPDEVYLVGSCMRPSWYVWPILVGDRTYYDIARSGAPEHWKFDPAKLVSLTRR